MAITLSSSDTFLLKETYVHPPVSGSITPVIHVPQRGSMLTGRWDHEAWNSNGPTALNTTNVSLNLTTGADHE